MTMSIEQQERFVVAIERLATALEKIAENTVTTRKGEPFSIADGLEMIDRGIDEISNVLEDR